MIQVPPPAIVAQVLPQLLSFIRQLGGISLQPQTAVTSWWRDPGHNAAVGGIPNSFHLSGLALDVVMPDPTKLVDEARRAGLDAIDYGTHVHLEPIGSPPTLVL